MTDVKDLSDKDLLALAQKMKISTNQRVEMNMTGYNRECSLLSFIDSMNEFLEYNSLKKEQVNVVMEESQYGSDDSDPRILLVASIPIDLTNEIVKNYLILKIENVLNTEKLQESYRRSIYENLKKEFEEK